MQNAKTKKTVKILLIFVRVPTVKLKNHMRIEGKVSIVTAT